MSELPHSNSESFEGKQEYDPQITELAVSGLSRVVGEQSDVTDDDDHDEKNNYDDDYSSYN